MEIGTRGGRNGDRTQHHKHSLSTFDLCRSLLLVRGSLAAAFHTSRCALVGVEVWNVGSGTGAFLGTPNLCNRFTSKTNFSRVSD